MLWQDICSSYYKALTYQHPWFPMAHLVFCVVLFCFLVVMAETQDRWGIFFYFSLSLFMFIQYIDSHARSHIFSMSMWFMYKCRSAICCCVAGIIIQHSIYDYQFLMKWPTWLYIWFNLQSGWQLTIDYILKQCL